VNEEKIVKSMP